MIGILSNLWSITVDIRNIVVIPDEISQLFIIKFDVGSLKSRIPDDICATSSESIPLFLIES